MSAEVQVELIKKIARDWALSDECSGVDAMVAIMDILNFNPYEEQRQAVERMVSEPAQATSGG